MKKSRTVCGIFIGFYLAALLSCNSLKGESLQLYSNSRLPLTEGWSYSFTGDANSFISLPSEKLKNLEDLIPEGQETIFLRLEFDMLPEWGDAPLGAYMGRIAMADKTYLNGVFIGGEGLFKKDTFSQWNKVRLYPLNADLIQKKGNVLLVHIWLDKEGAISGNPFISTLEVSRNVAFREQFWNVTINLLCAAVMLVMFLYHFIIYIKRPKEFANLLFALLNLISAIYLSNFFITDLPGNPFPFISFLLFQKIVANAMPFVILYMFSSFVREYLERKESHFITVIRIVFLVIPLVWIIISPDYGYLRSIRLLTQLFIFPPLFYILYMDLNGIYRKNPNALPILLGISPLMLTVIFDIIIHQVFNLYDWPYITSLGWQIVILVLLFILANRFAQALKDVEELNIDLEKKVDERTGQLTEANNKLTVINDDLITARLRADQDMKMAAFVQQSFFPRNAPSVEGWDISFVFKPMSGVSGDLYDFYTNGNKLTGLSLFDVSGHGIAAGLVTMLAKNIVFRTFKEKSEEALSTILSNIDKLLIQEKGDIENYLTGILLRLEGDRVEYVNAAHPDMLYRNAKSGKTRPVIIEGKDHKGRMLGIPSLSDGYTTVTFTMKEGNSLLIYSDCLVETRNAQDEEYGMERLLRSFSDSGEGTAADKLNAVLNDFYAFTKDIPLNDDLTAIVLQKGTRVPLL